MLSFRPIPPLFICSFAAFAQVFCSNPSEADAVAARLVRDGVPAAAFHGRAAARGAALDEFCSGELAVLVCTDLVRERAK